MWLLGLCNFPLGAYFAVMLLTVPQMLAAAGVPEPKIASVTAIGLIPSVVVPEEKGRLGAWFTVGNVAGGGLTAAIAIVVLRRLPFELGVALLGLLLLAPLPLFPWLPTPAPDRRLASESFREFFRDVLSLLRRRTVVWTLFLFALPAASFALTNMLSGLGRDFGTSEQMVGLVTGVGVTAAGIVGSLMVVPIGNLRKRPNRRPQQPVGHESSGPEPAAQRDLRSIRGSCVRTTGECQSRRRRQFKTCAAPDSSLKESHLKRLEVLKPAHLAR